MYQTVTDCSTLQRSTTADCHRLPKTAAHRNTVLQHNACASTMALQRSHSDAKSAIAATHCNTLQAHYNTLPHTATHCKLTGNTCNTIPVPRPRPCSVATLMLRPHPLQPRCTTLQHTATQPNTLRHTARRHNTCVSPMALQRNHSDGESSLAATADTCTNLGTPTSLHTCTHTCTHTHAHEYTHTYTHTHTHTYTHMHIHIHAHAHTLKLTPTHTHTLSLSLSTPYNKHQKSHTV